MIRPNLFLYTILFFSFCSSPGYTPELVINQLSGQWELEGIYRNGIHRFDTLRHTRFTISKKNYEGEVFIIKTDSGLMKHIYNVKNNERKFQVMQEVYILEFLVENNHANSLNYYLIPHHDYEGKHPRESLEVMLDNQDNIFTVTVDDNLILQYRSSQHKIITLTESKLVLLINGMEWRYKRFRNRL